MKTCSGIVKCRQNLSPEESCIWSKKSLYAWKTCWTACLNYNFSNMDQCITWLKSFRKKVERSFGICGKLGTLHVSRSNGRTSPLQLSSNFAMVLNLGVFCTAQDAIEALKFYARLYRLAREVFGVGRSWTSRTPRAQDWWCDCVENEEDKIGSQAFRKFLLANCM